MSLRRRIDALRRLADSTTFPAEAESARAKAERLEQLLRDEPDIPSDFDPRRFPSFEEAMGANWRNRVMERHAVEEAEKALGAVQWAAGKWTIPGVGPLVDQNELLRIYARGLAA